MYCLKPKMKKIPTGDWYCNECKPKERVKTPKKKARQVFNEEDDEDGNDEDEDQQDEERAGSSSDEVFRFFTRFGLVYTLIQRGQFSLQPPSPTLDWCVITYSDVPKVLKYMVIVNFPIQLDPRTSPSEKVSIFFEIYYRGKQVDVLYIISNVSNFGQSNVAKKTSMKELD